MAKGRDAKPHIGIFGRRNNGKSSLINALTGQEIAIVSEVAGTTTDPVKKSIEIAGIGPVVMIDTAGIDDTGELGMKRVGKTKEVLGLIDLAVLVIAGNEFADPEENLLRDFGSFDLPFVILHNKSDEAAITQALAEAIESRFGTRVIGFSAKHPVNLEEVIAALRAAIPETAYHRQTLVGDLISYGDVVLLITPIDIEAPEGRMILPQVQVIRDVLDHDSVAVVCKEREVDALLRRLSPRPVLAVTDSQVFPKADAAIPKDIPLTSFSIVLARQKGDFANYMKGTPHILKLQDGDRILILESCTHHVSCDDIGRVKIPRWLTNFTGKKLEFDVVAGLSRINRPMTDYAMVIQCGGCMITRKQLISRLKPAVDAGIPVSNYGMAIAYVHGIYNRAIAPFAGGEKEDYL
ncbi:MAG TPA: [FeFe] hydrogenase H-cluster maturation GTPase HydF [Bacteroidales bacterium]|nr:[FeFe] hydrogenase H-cluster maturation GTPase HydF [Bacteroidales bacterium]HPS63801.1 [FeFe] hydrogenase H-cluster maturation GTPase HydF [Bacteroidales bacterium]